ncbi:tripartite motif-containing protein 45-like [Patiria miniata]|uniref:B box-type domain-containing protein n=1 Tax=Patiria miniata TaxID=46514 RepID=A0A914ARS6_PATMI|nr:tripartite motif-containing protein 45-like [Patiria miniata]
MADVTLQDQVGEVSHVPLCDICGTNDAMHRCLDCSKNICKGCFQCHKQFPDLLDHTVATLEDIRQGKVVAKKTKRGGHSECGQHPGEVRRFYCQSCDELICRDCTVIDHPNTKGHDYVDLKTASTKLRKMLSGKLPELDKKKKGLEGVHKAARETKEKLKTNSERASLVVQKGAAKMIETIEKERDQILTEVKNITLTRNEKLYQSEKDVTTTILRIKHSQEIIQDIIRNAEDSDFLALFPEIKRDLQALSILDMPWVNDELSVLNVRSRETSGVKDLWELQLEPERRRMQIGLYSFPDDLETDG